MNNEEYPDFHSDSAIVHADLIKDICSCGTECKCEKNCDCSKCDCKVCSSLKCKCGGNCICG